MSILLCEIFTLRELCKFFIDNKYNLYNNNLSEILFISDIYLSFSDGTNYYKKYLNELRNTKAYLLTNNEGKNIYFREILQIFDIEFTKLVIRVKTEGKKYDVCISWKKLKDDIGIDKNDIENLIKK
jgi:hypothetical protein